MSDDDKISANAYYNLAKIKLIKGEQQLAAKYCNLAIELDPEIKKKIISDRRFEIIIEKLNIERQKEVRTRTTEKERRIINYLNNNFEINNTTTTSSKKDQVTHEDMELDY